MHAWGSGDQGNMLTRGLARAGSYPMQYAGPLSSAIALGGLPVGGASLGMPASIASATPFASVGHALFGTPLGATLTLGGTALSEGSQQLRGEAQDQGRAQTAQDIALGDPAAYRKVNPPPADPDQFQGWADQHFENRVEAENIKRNQQGMKPMNDAEKANFAQQHYAPLVQEQKERYEQHTADAVPGMKGPDGKLNPNGQIDTAGMDPKNVKGWMEAVPGRDKAVARMGQEGQQQLEELTKKLPPEMAQRLATPGAKLSPEDLETLKQQGVNVDQIQQTTQRTATAAALTWAHQNGGDFPAAMGQLQNGQTMTTAAESNQSLQEAGAAEAQSKGVDMWSGIKMVWDSMGPMGQILSVGGMALGAIGLMNAFSGEGGMGSILTTLLGGGAMALGANAGGLLPKGMSSFIDPILQQFGMGSISSTGGTPAAPTSSAAQNVARGPNGEPLAAGAPPAAPGAAPVPGAPGAAPGTPPAPGTGTALPAGGAANQVGVLDFSPEGRQKLLATPSADLVPQARQELAKLGLGQRFMLNTASKLWQRGNTAQVMDMVHGLGPQYADATPEEIGKMMEVYSLTGA